MLPQAESPTSPRTNSPGHDRPAGASPASSRRTVLTRTPFRARSVGLLLPLVGLALAGCGHGLAEAGAAAPAPDMAKAPIIRLPADAAPFDLLPPGATAVIEVRSPAELIKLVREHPLALDPDVRAAVESLWKADRFRELRDNLAAIAKTAGKPADEVAADLFGRGIVVAQYPPSATPGQPDAVVLFRGRGAGPMRDALKATLRSMPFPVSLLPVPPAEDTALWPLGPAVYTVMDDVLVVASRRAHGEHVLAVGRALSDAAEIAPNAGGVRAPPKGAATDAGIAAARKLRSPDAHVWAWADIPAAMKLQKKARLAPDKQDNLVSALLAAGLVEAAHVAGAASLELSVARGGLGLDVRLHPHEGRPFPAALPASHAWAMPDDDTSDQPAAPPGTFLRMTMQRGWADWWAARDKLVPDEQLAGIAQLDTFLSASFGGRDFGQEVLPTMRPPVRLLAALPDFTGRPAPAIRLPVGAVVLKCRNEAEAAAFQRAFKRLIGVLAYILGEQAKGDLDLDRETFRGTVVWFLRFDEADPARPSIRGNFSPSAFSIGDRFIVGSDLSFARELITRWAKDPAVPEGRPAPDAASSDGSTKAPVPAGGTRRLDSLHFDAAVARELAKLNEENLVAADMARTGRPREESAAEVARALRLASLFRGLSITTAVEEGSLRLRVQIDTVSPAAPPVRP